MTILGLTVKEMIQTAWGVAKFYAVVAFLLAFYMGLEAVCGK